MRVKNHDVKRVADFTFVISNSISEESMSFPRLRSNWIVLQGGKAVTDSRIPCQRRSVLLNEYIAATEREAEVVSALVQSKDKSHVLEKAMAAAEEAFGGAEQARILLRRHIETHGC